MTCAVLFDLYETLVTELDPNWREATSLWARLGVEKDHFWRCWRSSYEDRMCGKKSFQAALASMAAAGQVIEPGLLEELHAEHVESKRPLFQRIEPAIASMLRQLRERGLKLGLVSNAAPDEVPGWEESPLRGCFDAAVFSFEVGVAKPHPVIYQTCLDRLGVCAASAWFVGDGGSDELAGAQRAGMTPVWASWFLRRWPAPRLQEALREGVAEHVEAEAPARVIEHVERLRSARSVP